MERSRLSGLSCYPRNVRRSSLGLRGNRRIATGHGSGAARVSRRARFSHSQASRRSIATALSRRPCRAVLTRRARSPRQPLKSSLQRLPTISPYRGRGNQVPGLRAAIGEGGLNALRSATQAQRRVRATRQKVDREFQRKRPPRPYGRQGQTRKTVAEIKAGILGASA